MLNTIKKATVFLMLGCLSLATPAAAGTWDGTPQETLFEINDFSDGIFISNVVVKTGALTTNWNQTEAQITYNSGTCSVDRYLQLEMDVELIDDGYAYSGYGVINPPEGESDQVAIFQFDDIKLFPDVASVTVKAECYPLYN